MIARRFTASIAALAVASLALAACSTEEADAPGADDAVASVEAQEALERAYTGIGSTLEDLEPTSPEEGLKLYVMSCGEQLASCHLPSVAVVEAAEAAGWSGQIVDGKLNPEGFATAIRQAIAGGADVLVPIGISCGAAAAAFAEAKAAGVTIVGGGGVDDCDPQVWDSERLWLPDMQSSFFHVFGELMADYVYGKNDGDVKAIVINSTTNAWGPWITEAFEEHTAELGGEVLAVIDVSDPETANNSYLQKVTSALLDNPDANSLIVPTDSYLETGLAAAVSQAGFADQLTVIGGFGGDGAIDMIRNGQPGITATVAMGNGWQGWGSVDTAIRVRNGQAPAFIGQSIQVVDAARNLPESGPYEGSVDYRALFLESWGK
ncbi:sugar ABC transporter substrate-binding protein [Microbacterium album]|uniref:Periplasmic binding protein domain-containing protein n=1 Tax=Microbacterium album TaxID=2053191 RepID=A0A917ID23_9MICO|nr:substrate-binding domain-containing protein [Microbacterium album]GGH33615.1 hypothetical protein GCM10010921_00690 [Microbacterium album]